MFIASNGHRAGKKSESIVEGSNSSALGNMEEPLKPPVTKTSPILKQGHAEGVTRGVHVPTAVKEWVTGL